MNRLKTKTTATLLIAIFMISTFAVTIPVSAQTTWTVPGDFSTIQAAVNAASDGDIILVGPGGNWDGAIVDKDVEIRGLDGAVIDDGPFRFAWSAGFLLYSGSSGATISHFTFQGLEIPIYGLGVDDVTVEHNRIYGAGQGITNWDGDDWVIRHNVIEGLAVFHNGGGIGIAVGSRYGTASGNIVKNNRIVAHIYGQFTFSVGGILLCTDERFGNPGVVTGNKIVHNKVKITADGDSWAISLELIPPTSQAPTGTLTDNLVGFNDLRGSTVPLYYYPSTANLESLNKISRNLGEDANRGQGEVPANIFNPN